MQLHGFELLLFIKALGLDRLVSMRLHIKVKTRSPYSDLTLRICCRFSSSAYITDQDLTRLSVWVIVSENSKTFNPRYIEVAHDRVGSIRRLQIARIVTVLHWTLFWHSLIITVIQKLVMRMRMLCSMSSAEFCVICCTSRETCEINSAVGYAKTVSECIRS